jgi:hypothetical protein
MTTATTWIFVAVLVHGWFPDSALFTSMAGEKNPYVTELSFTDEQSKERCDDWEHSMAITAMPNVTNDGTWHRYCFERKDGEQITNCKQIAEKIEHAADDWALDKPNDPESKFQDQLAHAAKPETYGEQITRENHTLARFVRNYCIKKNLP